MEPTLIQGFWKISEIKSGILTLGHVPQMPYSLTRQSQKLPLLLQSRPWDVSYVRAASLKHRTSDPVPAPEVLQSLLKKLPEVPGSDYRGSKGVAQDLKSGHKAWHESCKILKFHGLRVGFKASNLLLAAAFRLSVSSSLSLYMCVYICMYIHMCTHTYMHMCMCDF